MNSQCVGYNGLPIARAKAFGVVLAFLIGVSSVSRTVRAQGQPSDAPIAQALFEEARTLMSAHKFGEACPKFAESQRLDPASGTLLNLAVCHEKQGKTASAWAEYNDVVAATRREGNPERQRIAEERIRDIEPKLCRLSVVSPNVMAPGILSLKIDGVELRSASWGMAIPVDPGSHAVEVSIHGKKPWFGRIALVGEGATSVVTVLAAEEASTATAERDAAHMRQAMEATADQDRRLAYVFGATSVAALGAGTYFGFRAKAAWDERNAHCHSTCDEQAVGASKNAHALAVAADISFGLGLLGSGFAAYFALSSGSRSPVAAKSNVSLVVGIHHIVLRGRF